MIKKPNSTMKHKGFFGSVEVSFEDNVLYGKLLHINDLVTYEASNPVELKTAFEEAVEDYLAFCKKIDLHVVL